jgi:hypothetical protein
MLVRLHKDQIVEILTVSSASEYVEQNSILGSDIIIVDAPDTVTMGQFRQPDNTYADNEYVSPSNVHTVFTKLEIMKRFTTAELQSIYTAAKTIVPVEVWLDMFKIAESIDVTDPETIAGMAALVSAGLLTQDRINTILAAV